MDYNWADPTKNSRLASKMMSKAEATRKKRLTSVKSSLSNQLHPGIEQKQRKTKKIVKSARREGGEEWDGAVYLQPGLNNNDLHELHSQLEAASANHKKASPQSAAGNNSSSASLDAMRHDVFSTPTLVVCNNKSSTFDEFGLNAAADGLFHPASTIEAFIEHDAKYHPEKLTSGPRHPRSGGEYPPSRESHKLPALHSGKAKRDRFSSRSESKLQQAGGHGSAPASIMSTASSSQLLDAREGYGKRQLSAAQSDSNLLAPRRLDVVPSSADRNALDFYEHDVEHDESSPRYALAAAQLVSDSELDNNRSHEASSVDVPPLDFSLARKFDELKRIMKSNRSKRDSGRHEDEPPGPEVPAHSASMAATTEQTALKCSSSKTRASKKSLPPSKTAAGACSSGPSGGKRGSSEVSSLSSAKDSAGKHLSADASSTMSHESLKPKRAVAVPYRKVPIAGMLAPPVRSRKEMKIRNGVSLSDLKAEHRAALEMLKELGGPVDVDYQREEIDAVTSTKTLSAYRSGKVNSGGISRSTGTTVQKSASSGLSSQAKPADLPTSPSTSTISGASLVTKLRASISSGRDRSHESSAETCSPIALSDSPTLSIGCKSGSEAIDATDNNDGGSPSPPVLSQSASEIAQGVINSSVLQGQLADVAEAEEDDEETQDESKQRGLDAQVQIEAAGNGEPEATPSHSAVSSLSPETSRASLEDSWRRYADNFHNDGDEELEEDVRSPGNNDQQERECDTGVDGTPPATRSGDRYSDEDFENEW